MSFNNRNLIFSLLKLIEKKTAFCMWNQMFDHRFYLIFSINSYINWSNRFIRTLTQLIDSTQINGKRKIWNLIRITRTFPSDKIWFMVNRDASHSTLLSFSICICACVSVCEWHQLRCFRSWHIGQQDHIKVHT